MAAEGMPYEGMSGKEEERESEKVEREAWRLLGKPSGQGRMHEGVEGGKSYVYAGVSMDPSRLRQA